MKISTVMILAAGLGKRLKPYTNKVPKPLIKIGKETILEKIIKKLRKYKVKKIVINVHYLKNKIKREINKKFKLNILFSEEKVLLDTGGGIKNALNILNTKYFFVINSDIIWIDKKNKLFKNLSNSWNEKKMDALLLLYPIKKKEKNLKPDFSVENSGRIINIKKNSQKYIFTGIQILKSDLFKKQKMKKFPLSIIYKELIKKKKIYGLIYKKNWFHLGTLDSLEKYKKML